jgi:hypothetical protein
MTSPFYPNGNPSSQGSRTFSVYVEPYLNTYYKTYQNIITLSAMPAGSLGDMVSMISSPKLSSFQQLGVMDNNVFGCKYALMRYPVSSGGGVSIKYRDTFMLDSDVPALLDYLLANQYEIETNVTRILQKSGLDSRGADSSYSGKKTLVCMVRYIGDAK